MATSLRALRRRVRRDERGIAIILVALLMIPLLVVAAIVVDLGNARQQKLNAQAISDSAALAAAAGLTAVPAAPYSNAFKYAFKSLKVASPPTSGTACVGVAGCETSTDAAGDTVTVTTPWQGNTAWVHVDVCWSMGTLFAPVAGIRALSICGHATANNLDTTAGSGSGGGTGPSTPSCTHNELGSLSTLTGPFTPSIPAQTISAVYTSTTTNLDTTRIVFVAPNSAGQLVKVNPPGGASPTYTLNPPAGGKIVTIAYTLPAGLYTASAALFVTDALGGDCGQAAWSTCGVSSHDDFFAPANGDQNGGHLLAVAGDYVVPQPGAAVSVGAELSATYYDETQFNPSRVVFNLDGTSLISDTATQPVPAVPTYSLTNDSNVNVAPPADSFATTGDSPLGTIGTPANGVSQVSSATFGSYGIVFGTSAKIAVTLKDYLADPLSNTTVTATPLSSATAVTGSAVTDGLGNASITVTDTRSEAVGFAVTATVNGTSYALGTVWVGYNVITNPATNPVTTGGKTPVAWTKDLNPHGNDSDGTAARFNSDYLVKVKSVVPSTNGWHSAFIYTFDLDQTAGGGDCTLTMYAFRVGGGSASGTRALDLVQ